MSNSRQEESSSRFFLCPKDLNWHFGLNLHNASSLRQLLAKVSFIWLIIATFFKNQIGNSVAHERHTPKFDVGSCNISFQHKTKEPHDVGDSLYLLHKRNFCSNFFLKILPTIFEKSIETNPLMQIGRLYETLRPQPFYCNIFQISGTWLDTLPTPAMKNLDFIYFWHPWFFPDQFFLDF